MRTAAILPVKRFAAAKSRLGETVAEQLRARLAQAMVADVLSALAQVSTLEATIVITREPSLPALAAAHGAVTIEDTAEQGQSAAVALGVRHAIAEGYERVLCVPGDCPALDPRELEALLRTADASVVIVSDRHGTGTNGLLLAPPDAIEPSFGPDSCERHRALASQAGASCRVEPVASLLLDVDTGADLAALRERLAGAPLPAERTRAVLGSAEELPAVAIDRAG
ncbi:MAG TPA: 2-phospho-L-lactate guanylyltransferase [Solirubrobacteraceae bacterium]|nr:2-phospho-L-lactate guanylyltransferase [Solirubrobacteraceae bacterium]